MLRDIIFQAKVKYLSPVEDSIKALLKWGASPDVDIREKQMLHRSNVKRKMSKISLVGQVTLCGQHTWGILSGLPYYISISKVGAE